MSCHEAAAVIESPFLQLASLGFIWIFFHCSPMCGPIVSGLQLGSTVNGSVFQGIFLYQLGRGVIYGIFGMLAGWFGSSEIFKQEWIGWGAVGVLGTMTIVQVLGTSGRIQIPPILLSFWAKSISHFKGKSRPFFLGMVLGFLPCMLSLWALSLAASTRHIFQGFLLMWLLIFMTSLPLWATALGGSWLMRGQGAKVSQGVLGFSTLWTALIVSASQGLIPHWHFSFEIFNRSYTLMFW